MEQGILSIILSTQKRFLVRRFSELIKSDIYVFSKKKKKNQIYMYACIVGDGVVSDLDASMSAYVKFH